MQVQTIVLFNMAMEKPEKISLQFELLNTFYSKIACKMSHTPDFTEAIKSFFHYDAIRILFHSKFPFYSAKQSY